MRHRLILLLPLALSCSSEAPLKVSGVADRLASRIEREKPGEPLDEKDKGTPDGSTLPPADSKDSETPQKVPDSAPAPDPVPTPIPTPPTDTGGSGGGSNPSPNPAPQVMAFSIPIGLENVNDSPMKAAAYQSLLRFVPKENITIDRFYFGFKLRGAACQDSGAAGYGKGDGGTMHGTLMEIDQTTGLPASVIDYDEINACTRYDQAKAETNNSNNAMIWIDVSASLIKGKMYAVVIKNTHISPANNFFSFNMPLADTSYAGPHARNELDPFVTGSLLHLDPREHVAWSSNSGTSWSYGSQNGQYLSYMNNNDNAHPATRMPQYGFRLSDGSKLAGQPYYAYSEDCIACTTGYRARTFRQEFNSLGGFITSGNNVGTLTITNLTTHAAATCTPSLGYGFRTCALASPFPVEIGEEYTVAATGSVETLKMDYGQRLWFADVGTSTSPFNAFRIDPPSAGFAKDVPSLWAAP